MAAQILEEWPKVEPVYWELKPKQLHSLHHIVHISKVHWRNGDRTLCGALIPEEKVAGTRYTTYDRCSRCEALGGKVTRVPSYDEMRSRARVPGTLAFTPPAAGSVRGAPRGPLER